MNEAGAFRTAMPQNKPKTEVEREQFVREKREQAGKASSEIKKREKQDILGLKEDMGSE